MDITECDRREIPRWERRLGYINDVCRSSRLVVHAMNRSDEPPRRSTADTLNIGKSDGTGGILAWVTARDVPSSSPEPVVAHSGRKISLQ